MLKYTFLHCLERVVPIHKLHWEGDLFCLKDLIVEVEVGYRHAEHLIILFSRLIKDGPWNVSKNNKISNSKYFLFFIKIIPS